MRKSELLITVVTSLTFTIILDQGFKAIFPAGWWIGNVLSPSFIIIGIISSLVGVFISFRTIFKIAYHDNLKKSILFGISTSLFFMIYVSIVVGIYHTYIPFEQWLSKWAFPVLLSSLIGYFIGFLLGGSRLQKMPVPQPRIPSAESVVRRDFSPTKAGPWILIFLLVGAIMGYFGGYIVWILFGQIQLALGILVPYAALFPPPPIYLVGWVILGALSFPFKILPELLK